MSIVATLVKNITVKITNPFLQCMSYNFYAGIPSYLVPIAPLSLHLGRFLMLFITVVSRIYAPRRPCSFASPGSLHYKMWAGLNGYDPRTDLVLGGVRIGMGCMNLVTVISRYTRVPVTLMSDPAYTPPVLQP